MTGRARTERTSQRARELFLKELAERGNVSDAAEAAGVGRRTAYQWREGDADFAALWAEAIERAADRLEREAWRRAVEGTDKPVYQGGELVGYVREYSDTLMQTLLKATRPDKYRERQEVQHGGRVAIEYVNDWRAEG